MTVSKRPAHIKVPPPPPPAPVTKKKFAVKDWVTNDGQRIIISGDTGMGKTSLSLLAPDPVFIGIDEGGADFVNPITNKPARRIPGIETYQDLRDVLQQPALFEGCQTVVVDTVTVVQDWAEFYVVAHIPTDKGRPVKNILGYGYNKGYKHLYNAMKDVLVDAEGLIHSGKNVIFIAQAAIHTVPHPGGEEFLRSGLNLHVDKSWDIEALYCQWADHIFRIDYLNAFVKDKKITGDTTRAIFAKPELWFRAKSRSIDAKVISFESKADDSLWRLMFPEDDNV